MIIGIRAAIRIEMKDKLNLESLLTNEFVCRDLFLYEGYNVGLDCPQCEIESQNCHCYDDIIRN